MLRLGVVAEQPPSRSRSVNPSPRNPATPGRWVLPICSGTAALDGSSSSGVGSVPFLTITSHSHSPVNAVKNTTNDCTHTNLDQLRTTLPARAHVCSYRFSTRWVEVLTRRVNATGKPEARPVCALSRSARDVGVYPKTTLFCSAYLQPPAQAAAKRLPNEDTQLAMGPLRVASWYWCRARPRPA
jgi:hypothetical protein